MKILQVNADSASYPIYITDNYNDLAQSLRDAGLAGRKAVIITDDNVAPLHLEGFKQAVAGVFSELNAVVFANGEENKHLGIINDFYQKFIELGLDRRSVVLAFGGGVVGDMAGFAAATYMRGVAYVQIPTTLLSQVDSSVGGKTGVDFGGLKNIVGAFYQPKLVYINVDLLKTLPREQLISGMGEVIKHGIIMDADYFAMLERDLEKILALDTEKMIEVVYGSCRIKAEVVSKDERESGLREILNFGHTFGHAVEGLCEFTIPHGHCVTLGSICALSYCVEHECLLKEDRERCLELFKRCEFIDRLSDVKFSSEDVYQRMFADKKTKDNTITLVCADRIGHAYSVKNPDKDAVMAAIREIF